jgi:hypothetical protein
VKSNGLNIDTETIYQDGEKCLYNETKGFSLFQEYGDMSVDGTDEIKHRKYARYELVDRIVCMADCFDEIILKDVISDMQADNNNEEYYGYDPIYIEKQLLLREYLTTQNPELLKNSIEVWDESEKEIIQLSKISDNKYKIIGNIPKDFY